MKNILFLNLIGFILVMIIFTLDRYISDEPKSKFGKWWRKNLTQKNEEND